QPPQRHHRVDLPAPQRLAAVGHRLDQSEVDAAKPYHGSEVALELLVPGIVSPRLELREIDAPFRAEQHALLLACCLHGGVDDVSYSRRLPRVDPAAVEQG